MPARDARYSVNLKIIKFQNCYVGSGAGSIYGCYGSYMDKKLSSSGCAIGATTTPAMTYLAHSSQDISSSSSSSVSLNSPLVSPTLVKKRRSWRAAWRNNNHKITKCNNKLVMQEDDLLSTSAPDSDESYVYVDPAANNHNNMCDNCSNYSAKQKFPLRGRRTHNNKNSNNRFDTTVGAQSKDSSFSDANDDELEARPLSTLILTHERTQSADNFMSECAHILGEINYSLMIREFI